MPGGSPVLIPRSRWVGAGISSGEDSRRFDFPREPTDNPFMSVRVFVVFLALLQSITGFGMNVGGSSAGSSCAGSSAEPLCCCAIPLATDSHSRWTTGPCSCDLRPGDSGSEPSSAPDLCRGSPSLRLAATASACLPTISVLEVPRAHLVFADHRSRGLPPRLQSLLCVWRA